jgi:CheY-like chemotaxis protein
MHREQTAFSPFSTVLVVENDVLKRLATAAALRKHGFEVFEAADIAEATTILETVAVDVLFSDASLIDGAKLTRWVKRRHLPLHMFWTAGVDSPQSMRRLDS